MLRKPFFRKHDNWWVIQMRQGTKRWQHKLCKGSPPKGSVKSKRPLLSFDSPVNRSGEKGRSAC
jgi:hypothetical protein